MSKCPRCYAALPFEGLVTCPGCGVVLATEPAAPPAPPPLPPSITPAAMPNPRPDGYLTTPIVPNKRRKNGALPGTVFPVPTGSIEHPTPEEIARVRRFFAAGLDEGTDCPCCTRYAQRQHRSFGSGPARWLMEIVWLSSSNGGDWVHTGACIKSIGGDNVSGSDATSILPLYGLIEEKDGGLAIEREDGSKPRTNGYWRPTAWGQRFVFGDRAHRPCSPEHLAPCRHRLLPLAARPRRLPLRPG